MHSALARSWITKRAQAEWCFGINCQQRKKEENRKKREWNRISMNIMTLGTSLWKRYKRLRAEREKTSDEECGTRETEAEKWGERIEWKPFLASICPNRTKMNRLRFGLNKVKNTNISWQCIRFVCVIYYTCASKDKWPLIRIDIFSLSTPKKNGFLLPVFFLARFICHDAKRH